MKTDDVSLPLLPEWTCKKVAITKAIIAQHKVKKKNKLHCQHCLKVLEEGDVSVRANVESKIIQSEKALTSSRRKKIYFFCTESCQRRFRLDLAEKSALVGTPVSTEPPETSSRGDVFFGGL